MHDVAKNVSMKAKVRRTRRGLGVAIGLLAAIIVFVVGIKALQIRKMMSMPQTMPPTTVSTYVGERGRVGSAADRRGIG